MMIEEFIEARLAEDEQIARTAGDGVRARWAYEDDEVYMPDTAHQENGRTWCQNVTQDSEGLTPSVDPEPTIASIWSDHADYRPEWAA